jgi:hypothetical protein
MEDGAKAERDIYVMPEKQFQKIRQQLTHALLTSHVLYAYAAGGPEYE